MNFILPKNGSGKKWQFSMGRKNGIEQIAKLLLLKLVIKLICI
jgi:hypothetical protein